MPFDPFADFDSRGYLRNHFGFKDVAQVKKLEYLAFRDALPDALTYLVDQSELTYSDVLMTHRILFEAVYPWAGEDRSKTAPEKSISKAGIDFAPPTEIERAVNYALQMGQRADFIQKKPGVVMGYLAYGHPFLDGNGRTLLTIFTILTQKAGLNVEWSRSTKQGYLEALTRELLEPEKGHLDLYLSPLLGDGQISNLRKHLMQIEGLNDQPE